MVTLDASLVFFTCDTCGELDVCEVHVLAEPCGTRIAYASGACGGKRRLVPEPHQAMFQAAQVMSSARWSGVRALALELGYKW
jgi:hypothetical protein